ncbi:MAG: DNA translocase FtsK 4TM domain-containing protein [Gammaproteobacteria bacterium]|nr:DNA translocase FtsK 4TM domain-containing protein [Gammaproteobacteria bacterium]
MAQIKRNKKFTKTKLNYLPKEIFNFFFLAFTLLFTLSIISYDPSDPNFFKTGLGDTINNYIGIFGSYVSHVTFMIFGKTTYFITVLLIYSVLERYGLVSSRSTIFSYKYSLLLLLIITSLSIISDFILAGTGGYLGHISLHYLSNYIGAYGSVTASLLTLLYSLVYYFDISVLRTYNQFKKIFTYLYLKIKYKVLKLYEKTNLQIQLAKQKKNNNENMIKKKPSATEVEIIKPKSIESKREFKEKQQTLFTDNNKLPLLEFLEKHNSEIINHDEESLKLMSEMLEQNLQHYGISAKVKAVKPGPIVTLFEIEPIAGTKAATISTISKDLARTMTVPSLRVVETVPGTAHIGIEIPNDDRETVSLKDIISSKEFENSKAALTMALGKDIQGKPVCVDLHKLPHLLVAGTTGSGKSVAVHSMIVSLLYKHDIENLKFLMIDPKMLELSTYEGLPHLLHPVVTDMNEAKSVLHWCVQEMERRYRFMMDLNVRNIQSYNKQLKQNIDDGIKTVYGPTEGNNEKFHEKLPYIVVVVDEFADMMQTVGKKVEDLITRLAQKARAAGIHLILATQRPSVNVITGLIKANIPTRIGLKVSSNIDSRTILDSMGAEQLLGLGDMLFRGSGTNVLQRIHGAFVSEGEITKIADFLRDQKRNDDIESILLDNDETENQEEINETSDELYNEAVNIIKDTKKTSISFLQRKLKIGYNRAANLIEAMEAKGILSEPQSNGNRDIL